MPRTFKEVSELIVGLRQAAEGIRAHVGEDWNPDIAMADFFDAKALGLEMLIPQIIDLENESKLKTKEFEGYLDVIMEGIEKLRGFIAQKCILTGEDSVDVCNRFNIPVQTRNATHAQMIIWGRTIMVSFADMDGTDYEPPDSIKDLIIDNTPAAETAQEEARNIDAQLTNLTQQKDELADEADEKRDLLRDSLWNMLPNKRRDKRLDDYGFDFYSSSGGGGEEPGPEPPENWDEAPTGFTVTKSIGDSIDIDCVIHADADGINVYHAEGPFGDDMVQPRPESPEWANVPMPLQVDVAYNVRHWIWVCAVKDGVEGDFAGPLWIEFKEEIPR